MIKPTVGRVVWFYPNEQEDRGYRLSKDQPCKADICYVHDDTKVNVVVTSHEGIQVQIYGIRLLQEGEEKPAERHVAWMPYQVGQAKAAAPVKDADAEILEGK